MELTDTDKREILLLARLSVIAAASSRALPENVFKEGVLTEKCGTFVTLHTVSGKLRGCIGVFKTDKTLADVIIEMGAAAALRDTRFRPVTPEELGDITIEVSVLSPLRKITDPSEVIVGEHGLYIIKGTFHGVLLPQVAVEHGFDRDTFLSETCMKAGLPPDEWRKGAEIFVFTAEVFSEATHNPSS